MAERARRRDEAAVLRIRGLHVYYGQSHALQGVDLDLPHGVVSVVGRNGMGKTTLCNAITGLVPIARGSIQFEGDELAGMSPSRIAHHGVGYVPQGRRLWASLTVDEHLRLCERGVRGGWTRERIYDAFPRLAERRTSRGGQLSGGEQQMLAISRALLLNPRLLVMDEPTEGLAPVIVQQGRGHADPDRRGGRDLGARHRAEHRGGHCGFGPRRNHGQTVVSTASWTRKRWRPTASSSNDSSASGATVGRGSWRSRTRARRALRARRRSGSSRA